ncbi:MAG: hypothetical protein Q8P41_00290 [Pseudomonadota bacterium]|nr:hypothetical protein [Pseudomonadota bacterium]
MQDSGDTLQVRAAGTAAVDEAEVGGWAPRGSRTAGVDPIGGMVLAAALVGLPARRRRTAP